LGSEPVGSGWAVGTVVRHMAKADRMEGGIFWLFGWILSGLVIGIYERNNLLETGLDSAYGGRLAGGDMISWGDM